MRVQPRTLVAHSTPTRMRIKLVKARRCADDLAVLKQLLLQQADVLTVHFNPLTGSLLVQHDNAPERRGSILAALAATDQSGLRSAPLERGLRSAQEAVARAALEWLIERAVQAAVAAAV